MICEAVPGLDWRMEEFPKVLELDIAWPLVVELCCIIALIKVPTRTLAAFFGIRGSWVRFLFLFLFFLKLITYMWSHGGDRVRQRQSVWIQGSMAVNRLSRTAKER